MIEYYGGIVESEEKEYVSFDSWKTECGDLGLITTKNTGNSENYGDTGDYDALRPGGFDHQADVVAVWNSSENFGWISFDTNIEIREEKQ